MSSGAIGHGIGQLMSGLIPSQASHDVIRSSQISNSFVNIGLHGAARDRISIVLGNSSGDRLNNGDPLSTVVNLAFQVSGIDIDLLTGGSSGQSVIRSGQQLYSFAEGDSALIDFLGIAQEVQVIRIQSSSLSSIISSRVYDMPF